MKVFFNQLRTCADLSKKEGFCVLTDGVKNQHQLYIDPVEKMSELPVDLKPHQLVLGHLSYPNPQLKNEIPERRFYSFDESIKSQLPSIGSPLDLTFKSAGQLEMSVEKSDYLKKIKRVKTLLELGEIYQLNYAIRFRKRFEGNPFGLYLKLMEVNPTAFSAFLNCGNYQILSNSPERLFQVGGQKIITEPIKGTAARGPNFKGPILNSKTKMDPQLQQLLDSEKERAELDMITDLARNDVGQICEFGSLKLEKNREVMALPNLWHTYSRVSGKLPKNMAISQVIEALFPGGSITGCPKKRAKQYIEELERLPRNIFTGSIGYITPKKTDFNIAIRTALVKDGYIEYWAGGGIVADSDPEAEYEECFLKAEKFLRLLG